MPNFEEHILAFLDYLAKNKRMSPHTVKAYQIDLDQFNAYLQSLGNPSLAQLKSLHIRSWMADLMSNDIKARSINRKLSSLRAYFKYLRERSYLDQNPMAKVVAPKMPKHLVKDIPARDLHDLFERFPWGEVEHGERDRLLLLLLYTTGMRLSELIGLKWTDVDFARNSLRVLGKRNKVRILPLHPELSDLLKMYHSRSGGRYSVFERESGEPFYPVLVYRLVNHYLRLFSHASKTSPHVLRHSFATHMLNNGANLMAIKDLLGHANLAATQVYTKNSFEKLKKIHNLHPRK
jgi:integrase/recombinase XerC